MTNDRFYTIFLSSFLLFCNSPLNAQSTVDTDFWVTFLSNGTVDTLSLIATGNDSCTGIVSNPNTGWTSSFSVNPESVTKIYIPTWVANDAEASGTVINKALHITTTDSISLYAANYRLHAFDVTNVLPTPLLGSDYIVQTHTDKSEFSVIATEDSTTITINLSVNSSAYTANTPFTITLNKGQCYQLQSGIGVDYSGTTISANDNKKIAVFAGNRCASIPHVCCCDHLVEQMMPISLWGNEFIVTPTMLRTNDRVRITAMNDGCMVRKNGVLLTTLSARQIFEFEITDTTSAVYIETSEPAGVFLYFTSSVYGGGYGDPSMVIINPIDQKINDVTFTTFNIPASDYKHFVNIVTNTDNTSNMKLNDTTISSYFDLVPAKPEYSYARIEINHGIHKLSNIHSVEDNGFIAHVYGLGDMESYSYSVGTMIVDVQPQVIVNGFYSSDYPSGFETCPNRDGDFTFDLKLKGVPSNVLWDFGDGATGEGFPINHQYYESGIYNVSCNIYRIQTGIEYLDTTLTTLLSIKTPKDTTITASICPGEVYTANGFNENKAGIYIDTLQTIYGCDSIVRLNLTINPIHNDTIFAYICEGEVYDQYGFYETRDTIITRQLQTIYGCDSIVTLVLKVGKVYTDTIYATIREGEYYNEYGFYEYREGFYSRYYMTTFGCDSSTYLVLNVVQKSDLYVENCITPMSSTNNRFEIIHDEAFVIDDVYIYNRAGGLVFHSPNNSEPWDGRCKGEYCPQAAYTYVIYYRQVGVMGQKVKVGNILVLY